MRLLKADGWQLELSPLLSRLERVLDRLEAIPVDIEPRSATALMP